MRIDEVDFGGRPKLEGYGGGGFRLSGVLHRGSLLLLPSGPRPWAPTQSEDLTFEDFAPAIAEAAEIEVLLLGTGAKFHPLERALKFRLLEAGLKIDPMDSGAACRTFNVLLMENRRAAAALIAFD